MIKARFKSDGNIITGKAAEVFIKIGIADQIFDEVKPVEIKTVEPTDSVKEKPKEKPKPVIKKQVKKRGRPKAKK